MGKTLTGVKKYLKNNNYGLNVWEQAAGSKTT